MGESEVYKGDGGGIITILGTKAIWTN